MFIISGEKVQDDYDDVHHAVQKQCVREHVEVARLF